MEKTKEVLLVDDIPNKEVASTTQPNNKPKMEILSQLDNTIKKRYWDKANLDSYLSNKLIDTIEWAMVADQRWVLQIDYKTRLRAIETILKVDKQLWNNNNISIWFFSPPKSLKF